MTSKAAINRQASGARMTPRHEKALALLAAPINDRPREFQPFLDHILLLDDSGGECVTRFDDATAVHYFLKWLHEERAIKALIDKCEDRIANKIAARTLCKKNQPQSHTQQAQAATETVAKTGRKGVGHG